MSQLTPPSPTNDSNRILSALRPSGIGIVRLSAASLALASVALAPAQALFSATEHAEAGQAISVTGSGFDPSTRLTIQRYGSTGVLGANASVPISSQSEIGLVAKVPAGLAFGLYRLQASSAAGAGGTILLNAPRIQWTNAKQAMPGGSVRIVGRNLRPTAAAATVRLVDVATSASMPAIVTAVSDYDLSFTMPVGVVAGHSYRVYVNSNIAGTASETLAPDTIAAVAPAGDPFGLGTAWGADFVPVAAQVYNIRTDTRLPMRAAGDGVADDTPALQAAINYATSHGGGTVYIPRGTYRIDNGNGIMLGTRVVLKGDGISSTILQVGYRYNASVVPTSDTWAMMIPGGPDTGLTELTIRNLNTGATPNMVLRGQGGFLISRFFMKNVNVETNNGSAISLNKMREGVIQGCSFRSTCITTGPIDLYASRDLRFSSNTVDYRAGRLWITMGQRNVVEGNNIRVDTTSYGPNIETGGIELSYSQQTLVKGNSVTAYGNRTNRFDGEMIMTQAMTADLYDAGRVASTSGLRLSETGRDWSGSWLCAYQDDLDRSFVAITRGKGAGQWRRVAAHDSTSLTVDRAWAVSPDATSTYAVGSLIAYQQTWIGNSVKNGWCGLMLFDGGLDCAIANNALTDTGGILVRADSQPAPTPQGILAQCLAWDISIRDNSIATTSARTAACVALDAVITGPVASQASMGSLILGTSALGNRVAGSNASLYSAYCQYDGYEVIAGNEGGITPDSLTNWGTVIWNNSVTGSLRPLKINIDSTALQADLSTTTATAN